MINSIIKDKVISQLDLNYNSDRENAIDVLIDDYIQIAIQSSNRNDLKIVPYVKNAVVEAYLRLGLEGNKTSSVGGMSNTFVDIEEKLVNDCKKIRKLF